MPSRARLWFAFGVVAIAGNLVVFRYFYHLPILSERGMFGISGTLSILLGLFVLDVFRRDGGWTAAGKALPNIPGACILGGCIALSVAADSLLLAIVFVLAAFLGLVAGAYLWLTGRLDPQPKTRR